MTGSTIFHLTLCSTNLTRRIVKITNDFVDLSVVLSKYHEFADIFGNVKAKNMASYYLYNLQIKLENRKKLPVGTIYLLLATEQEVLKKL